MPVEGLGRIYALPLVQFVHLELVLAPLILNISTSSLIAHFAELEGAATILYLPNFLSRRKIIWKLPDLVPLLVTNYAPLARLVLLIAPHELILVALHESSTRRYLSLA